MMTKERRALFEMVHAVLTFGQGNAKLADIIHTFSLPAGWTCPSAKECLSKADMNTGRITDGKDCRFRCFAASNECRCLSVRVARWRNFNALKKARTVSAMANLIQRSLPFGVQKVRVHVSGDYYSEAYFLAWLNVAINNPNVIFYGYTKRCDLIVKYKAQFPGNFRLTASKGGKYDNLIEKHNLIFAEVVFTTEEARRKGLEIDHDDSHAIACDKPYALLLHGTQPSGTEAGEAWKIIKKTVGGYNRKSRKARAEPNPKRFLRDFRCVLLSLVVILMFGGRAGWVVLFGVICDTVAPAWSGPYSAGPAWLR